MKKKLVAILFVSALVIGFAKQEPTHADYQPPRITSIQPGTATLSS